MRNIKSKRCYYCGKPATSKEHAPPKQFFKGFECDRITVPSCDDHNTKKSGHDQAIVSAFLLPLHTGGDNWQLSPGTIRAITEALPSFERTKRKAIRSSLFQNPPNEYGNLPELAFLVPEVNIAAWIRQLTAALVFSAIGPMSLSIQWQNAFTWSPDWFATNGPASLAFSHTVAMIIKHKEIQRILDLLPWQKGWSATPRPYPSDIYSFQVITNSPPEIVFRHRFYDQYSWYVWFKTSAKNILGIQDKLTRVDS